MAIKTTFLIPTLCFFIFFAAFLVRFYKINEGIIYPDEITWVVNGKELVYNLRGFNFYNLRHGWWNKKGDAMAIGIPTTLLGGIGYVLFAGVSRYSLHLYNDIVAARIPLLFLNSLTPVFIFLIAHLYKKDKVGIVAAISYLLSPISIGLDRWAIHDGPLTLFCLASIYYFLRFTKTQKLSGLAGVFFGLACITKPNGLLLPIAWITYLLFKKTKRNLQFTFLNLFTGYLVILLFWPESWFNPLFAFPKYILNQFILVKGGDPIYNFYLGQATTTPNFTYYFFQTLFRTPEPVLIFALLGAWLAFKKRILERYFEFLPVLSFIVLFFLFMTFTGLKGGIRYILPLIPWLYLIASFGFVEIITKSKIWMLYLFFWTMGVISPLLYSPNYYLFYNSFIGGPGNAQKYDMVGLCFGSRPALAFIDQFKLKGNIGIVGCTESPYYYGHYDLTKNWPKAEYLVVETTFKQSKPSWPILKTLDKRELVARVYQMGVLTAEIYH